MEGGLGEMLVLGRKEMDDLTPHECSAQGRGVLSTGGRGAQPKHRFGFSQPHERRSSAGAQLGEV